MNDAHRKTEHRVMTESGTCHKTCAYHKYCSGFRNRNKRCPQWALNIALNRYRQEDSK